jgi:hypothetical protein
MSENIIPKQPNAEAPAPVGKKPNETGSISVQGFIKIFDPDTKRVFVEKRA